MNSTLIINRIMEIAEKTGVPALLASMPGFGRISAIKGFCDIKNFKLIVINTSNFQEAFNDFKNTTTKRSVLYFQDLTMLQLNQQQMINSLISGTVEFFTYYGFDAKIFLTDNADVNCPVKVNPDMTPIIIGSLDLYQSLNIINLSRSLFNKFVVVNLKYEDMNENEIISNHIETVMSSDLKNRISYFLSPENNSNGAFDTSKLGEIFKEIIHSSIKTSHDITFYNMNISGFLTARSLYNIFIVIKTYLDEYGDDQPEYLTRIVKDTLGISITQTLGFK